LIHPREKARGTRLSYSLDCLRGFVPHGTPDFLRKVCRKFIHAVLFTAMFRALFQNVLFSLASRHEITIHTDIPTRNYLGHIASSEFSYLSFRLVVGF